MRVIFGLVLMAGLALAGGAVYLAQNYISGYQQALAKERAARERMVKTVPIYVADRTLAYGEPLTMEDVREVHWPENAIPEGVFASEDALFPRGQEIPRVVLRAMEKDEAILAIKVTEPGEDAGITSRLERGMRAFALNVDVSSGVSGFLRPGDRVDVYWTGKVNSGLGNQQRTDVTKLIEAGVKLIAVDQNATSDLSSTVVARTVTVAASPQQVASLAQAQSTGRLSLSLVGSGDDVVAEAVQVDQYRLLGLTREVEAVVEAEAPEKVCTTKVRRGTEEIHKEIPCPEG